MASRSRLVVRTVSSAIGQQLFHERGDHVEQVLAIVQDEQGPAPGQMLVQGRIQRPAGAFGDAEECGHRLADESRRTGTRSANAAPDG